jgi:hypothetical protein
MSSFTDQLTLTHLDINWRLWRIERDFTYEVGALGSGRKITVPNGFLVDGASIPRPLWSLLPSWGSYSRAAVIHDYLCYRIGDKRPHPEGLDRKMADDVFLEAMRVCGTAPPVRFVMHSAVRLADIAETLIRHKSVNIVSSANPPGK